LLFRRLFLSLLFLCNPFFALIPSDLLQELVQDARRESEDCVQTSIDEPLAEHLPCPHHFTLDFLTLLAPLLLPLEFLFQLLQVFLVLVGGPVLSRVFVVGAIQRDSDLEDAFSHEAAAHAPKLEVLCLRPVSYVLVV